MRVAFTTYYAAFSRRGYGNFQFSSMCFARETRRVSQQKLRLHILLRIAHDRPETFIGIGERDTILSFGRPALKFRDIKIEKRRYRSRVRRRTNCSIVADEEEAGEEKDEGEEEGGRKPGNSVPRDPPSVRFDFPAALHFLRFILEGRISNGGPGICSLMRESGLGTCSFR